MDAVSEILDDRSRTADSLSRMLVVSMIAHVAIITGLALAPRMNGLAEDRSRAMTIVLGGAEGPEQGRNPMSAPKVQEAVPDAPKQAYTPPAPTKPEMIEPVKTAPPAKGTPKPDAPKPAPQLQGRTPSKGAEVTKGTARVETNSTTQTPFGGLATGGGGTGGAYTDYADFCCPEYLAQVVTLIRRNWQQHQGQAGTNKLKFTIARDGTIDNISVVEGTNQLLNLASQRALIQTRSVPPLPAAFTPPRLTVYLGFEYLR